MGHHVQLGSGGRLVVPAPVRNELGLTEGARLLVRVEDGRIVVEPVAAAVARAQAIVRRRVPAGVSLSDELSAERREEAARE